MNKIYKLTFVVLGVVFPLLASAQLSGTRRLIDAVGDLIRILIVVVSALALLAFLWGLAKFIFKLGGEGEKAVAEGKNLMKWGLIALFVMVSVWGIIYFIQGELGLTRSNTPGGLPGTIPVQTGFPSQLPGQPVQLKPPSSSSGGWSFWQ